MCSERSWSQRGQIRKSDEEDCSNIQDHEDLEVGKRNTIIQIKKVKIKRTIDHVQGYLEGGFDDIIR